MGLATRFKNFSRDAGGNVATTLAIAAIPLMAAAGGAADYSRYVGARTALFAAMDAAVLAGTKVYMENGKKPEPALAAAKDYFTKSMGEGYEFASMDLKFKINKTNNGVAAYGDVAIATPLLSVAGIHSLPLLSRTIDEADVAIGTPPGGAENVEISLMLDVTGSMCDDGVGPCSTGAKISAMKTAASNLVDKVLGPGSSTKNTRIAVIPFSTRLRLDKDGQGGAIMKAVTNLNPNWTGYESVCTAGSGSGGSETAGNWTCSQSAVQKFTNIKIMPCVTDRYYNSLNAFDLTDDAPGPGKWLNAHGGDRMTVSADSTDQAAQQGTGLTTNDPAYQWNYVDGGSCADVGNADIVQPLDNNATQIKSNISALSAYGSTDGVGGTAFAWYTLSPKWSGVWPGSARPGSYSDITATGNSGAQKLRKIAVLMTDGGYNTYRGWKGADISMVSTNAKAMCANMKKTGIEVYAVGFNLNNLSSQEASYAKDTLSSCASDATHYINADSPADLIAAFDSIGKELTASNIRLTK